MVIETVFRIANFLAVIGWMVLLPAALFGWQRGLERVCGAIIPMILAGAYGLVLVSFWGRVHVDVDSVAAISAMFRQPAAALAGWLHYLAFDLLIGVMLAQRMREDGVPWFVMMTILVLTAFAGPAGFLLFQGVRVARGNSAGKAQTARRRA